MKSDAPTTSTDLVSRTFDYDAAEISKSDAKSLERHAAAIVATQDRVRRLTVEGVMEVGAELAAARDELSNHGNGTFGKWCKQRCGITSQTARNAIRVFEQFADSKTVLQSFDVSALYLLSSESCPEDAVSEAMERAGAGEHITQKSVREILRASCPNQPETDEPETDEFDADEFDADEPETDELDAGSVDAGDLDKTDEALTWNPRDCQRDVMKWRHICPRKNIGELAEILRAILSQIEGTQDD